ncbi:hypothetical protein GW916_12100 [bacterium]|nr:hypothetical protein [bacterium]
MKKWLVLLTVAALTLALVLLGRQSDEEKVFFGVNDKATELESPSKKISQTSAGLESKKQTEQVPAENSGTFRSEDLQIIESCLKGAQFRPKLNLGDRLEHLMDQAEKQFHWISHLEIENLHFKDALGKELRFQILDIEKESRFFDVDLEGLPIRRDPPEGYAQLNPKQQRAALIRQFGSAIYSDSRLRLVDERTQESVLARTRNGEIVEFQMFFKSEGPDLKSLACGSLGLKRVQCKCL